MRTVLRVVLWLGVSFLAGFLVAVIFDLLVTEDISGEEESPEVFVERGDRQLPGKELFARDRDGDIIYYKGE